MWERCSWTREQHWSDGKLPVAAGDAVMSNICRGLSKKWGMGLAVTGSSSKE